MENLKYWDNLSQPPEWALREIKGGRLSGKTDINPQWRYHALTELFGPCGIGWKFTIDEVWAVDAIDGQVFAFAKVHLYIKYDEWSDPIPGLGGSMLVVKEKHGLHANDEGYKMAITDALSTAVKMIGVASDVYMGLWDGSKYLDKKKTNGGDKKKSEPEEKPKGTTTNFDFLKVVKSIKIALNAITGDNELYYNILGGSGYQKSNEITDRDEQKTVYAALKKQLDDLKDDDIPI